jgi:hypothetical protein
MNRRTFRIDEWWFVVLTVLLVIAALAPGDAYASGDCRDGSCNETILSGGDNTATNSAVVGGSDNITMATGLGDVYAWVTELLYNSTHEAQAMDKQAASGLGS